MKKTQIFIFWVLLVVVMVAVVHDAWSQEGWIQGFLESFATWLRHPSTSLSLWRPRIPPLIEVVVGCAFLLLGAWSSLLSLRATRLQGDRLAFAGLTGILSVALAGLVGTFLVTFGWIRVSGLLFGIGTMAVLLCILTIRSGGLRQLVVPLRRVEPVTEVDDEMRTVWRSVGEWGTRLVVGVIVLFVGLRDLISPVVEWDATVYHAELARLWFLERPHPPLIFGPSLGVEISANYPPLFPASGLVADLSAGRVTDVALRLASPLIFVGLLLFVFAFTRARFGRRSAWWTLFLLGTTPLVVLYSSWSTSYLLTTALGLVAVAFFVEASENMFLQLRLWIASGVFLGLAILSSFYGWLFVVAALIAIFSNRLRWSERFRASLALAVTAFLVGGVWLIRNWVELGDPLYPLSLPLFHARGLAGPLWGAAQTELRTNANSYWIGSHSFLRVRQLATLLFDRHLVAVGSLPIAALCWYSRFRCRGQTLLAIVAAVILGIELVPGWFWLRSLLLAVPLLAVAGGVALSSLDDATRGQEDPLSSGLRSKGARSLVRGSVLVLFASLALVASVVALAITVAGPGQSTWTTQLPSGTNFAALDEELGSNSSTLWSVFGGDYEAWDWLNQHLGDGRLATFDIRTYYLNNPGSIFYLDGREAEPLLRMKEPSEVLSFFQRQGVRYIFMPAWAMGQTATRDPAVDLLPFHRFVGDKDFPLVATFAPTDSFPLSAIYQVGGKVGAVGSAIVPGPDSPSPLNGGNYDFAAGSIDGWILVPNFPGEREDLRIRYFDSSRSEVSFSAYVTGGAWNLDFAKIRMFGTDEWRTVTVPIPMSASGNTSLSVDVGSGAFEVQSALAFPER